MSPGTGGEEFALILPRCDQEEACLAAERHRLAVELRKFAAGLGISVTISIGAATYPRDAADGLQLIDVADQALYKAKHNGRNRVGQQPGGTSAKRPRFPLEMNVVFQYLEKEGLLGAAETRNISLTGMLGMTRMHVQEGGLLEIHFGPSGHEVKVLGECVRVHEDESEDDVYLIGVRFNFENDSQKNAVQNLIKKKHITPNA